MPSANRSIRLDELRRCDLGNVGRRIHLRSASSGDSRGMAQTSSHYQTEAKKVSGSLLIASVRPYCIHALTLCARKSSRGSWLVKNCASVFSDATTTVSSEYGFAAKTSHGRDEISKRCHLTPITPSGDSSISRSFFGCVARADSAGNGRSKVSRALNSVAPPSDGPSIATACALPGSKHSLPVFPLRPVPARDSASECVSCTGSPGSRAPYSTEFA